MGCLVDDEGKEEDVEEEAEAGSHVVEPYENGQKVHLAGLKERLFWRGIGTNRRGRGGHGQDWGTSK